MIQLEDASGFPWQRRHASDAFDERELVAILRSASQSGTPVTIVGARTGLAGGGMPDGGIAVSMDRFRRMNCARRGDGRSGRAASGFAGGIRRKWVSFTALIAPRTRPR